LVVAEDPQRLHGTTPISHQPELDMLLSSLRRQWQQSEPAKRGDWQASSRTCRTRVDPTLGFWSLVLQWLMDDPLRTGQQAMQRLEGEQPGLYAGSLPALQRRIDEWRIAQAERVVGQQMGAIHEPTRSPTYWIRSKMEKGSFGSFYCCEMLLNQIL